MNNTIDIIVGKNAYYPVYETEGSVGADLAVPNPGVVLPPGRSIIPLGIRMALGENMEAQIRPRSGLNARGFPARRCFCDMSSMAFLYRGPEDNPLNSEVENLPIEGWHALKDEAQANYDVDVMLGTIDSDYRGEIGAIVKNNTSEHLFIEGGTRIAQLVVAPVVIADFHITGQISCDTERGEQGFGHTGTGSA